MAPDGKQSKKFMCDSEQTLNFDTAIWMPKRDALVLKEQELGTKGLKLDEM